MDYKIDNGPWETVFFGNTYGHEVEIATNPDNFFLVFIYDKKDGKRVGAVIEGYRAYFAKGAMEPFIQTLPKPSFGVEKSIGDKTGKIFFLSFDPFYVDFKQDDFLRKVDSAVNKTEENAATITDLARASSLDLKDLSTIAKADYAPILGDPFMIKLLIAGQRPMELSKVEVGRQASAYEEKSPMIQLGLSKTREILKEPAENLRRTQIVGQGLPMLYAMYILAENFLLEDIPLIIFDPGDYFDGLGISTSDTFALKEDLVDFEPLGFPMRQFVAKGSIRISMKDVDLFFALDLLGMNDPEFQKTVSLLSSALRASLPEELAQKILESKDAPEYDKLKAERVLMIISKKYPELFGEEISSTELTKRVPGKIGRAVLIDTKNLSKEEKILFTHTLMRQLTKSFSDTQQTNCTILLPEAGMLFEQDAEKAGTAIMRLENRGLGVVMGLNTNAPEELEQTLSAKINIVSGKDVAVSIKSKRNYRVILRPSLSGKPKIE